MLKISVEKAWRTALEFDSFNEGDNFFDLGGDSLAAVVATQVLSDETGHDIDLELIFETESFAAYVSGVARHIEQRG